MEWFLTMITVKMACCLGIYSWCMTMITEFLTILETNGILTMISIRTANGILSTLVVKQNIMKQIEKVDLGNQNEMSIMTWKHCFSSTLFVLDNFQWFHKSINKILYSKE